MDSIRASARGRWPLRADVGDRLIRALRFTGGDERAVVVGLGATDRQVADEIAWFDAGSGRFVETVVAPSWFLDVVPHEGDRAALIATDGHAVVCTRGDGACREHCAFGTDAAWELSADESGNRIAGAFLKGPDPLHVLTFDRTRTLAFEDPPGSVFARMSPRTAISPSGARVAFSFGFGATGVWNLPDGSAVTLPSVEASTIETVGDARRLAHVREFLSVTGAMPRRIWLSRDDARLAVAGMIPYRSAAPFMCLWLVRLDSERPGTLLNLDSTMAGVDLTPGFDLCVASFGQIRDRLAIWDVAGARRLADFDAGVDEVTDVRIDPGGGHIAVAGRGQFSLHRFAARRWVDESGTGDAFWMIDLDGRRTFGAIGGDDFVRGFTEGMEDARGSWDEGVDVARRLGRDR